MEFRRRSRGLEESLGSDNKSRVLCLSSHSGEAWGVDGSGLTIASPDYHILRVESNHLYPLLARKASAGPSRVT